MVHAPRLSHCQHSCIAAVAVSQMGEADAAQEGLCAGGGEGGEDAAGRAGGQGVCGPVSGPLCGPGASGNVGCMAGLAMWMVNRPWQNARLKQKASLFLGLWGKGSSTWSGDSCGGGSSKLGGAPSGWSGRGT